MNNKTDIEEDIKKIEEYIGLFYEFPNPKSVSIRDYDVQAIENIIADRERLIKENENWEKYNLEKEEDTNRVIAEYREMESKANKYDSLVEKIKETMFELKEARKTKYDRAYGLNFESREQQDIDKQIEILQELLDTEK